MRPLGPCLHLHYPFRSEERKAATRGLSEMRRVVPLVGRRIVYLGASAAERSAAQCSGAAKL